MDNIKDTVVFTDWFSVNQIPNSIDPKLKVSASGMYDKDRNLQGYELTVTNSAVPGIPPCILYRIRVEDAREDSWSLSSEAALIFLNKIGFSCKMVSKEEPFSDNVVNTLKALQNFGYTHICRTCDANSNFFVEAWSAVDETPSYNLSTAPNYNYDDWYFLPLGDPQMISGLLAEGGYDNEETD